MSDAVITLPIKASPEQVWDVVCRIFIDSFERQILFANYMAPRLVDSKSLQRGAKIEALVQADRVENWVAGEILAFRDTGPNFIRFRFDSAAYHKNFSVQYPNIQIGRRTEFSYD